MDLIRTTTAAWHAFHYYLGLTLFGLGCLLLQVLAEVGRLPPFRRPAYRRRSRAIIRAYLWAYVRFFDFTGTMRVRMVGWKKDFERLPGVLVANHPSMLDAPVLLSRAQDGICIFKSSLTQSLLRGNAADAAGYVNSASGVDGIRAAVEHVKEGGQFIMFPESTRTPRGPAVALKSTYALVAKYADVPVHVFVIESNSNVLTKGQPIFRLPSLPLRMTIRHLGTVEPSEAATGQQLHARVSDLLRPHLRRHWEGAAP